MLGRGIRPPSMAGRLLDRLREPVEDTGNGQVIGPERGLTDGERALQQRQCDPQPASDQEIVGHSQKIINGTVGRSIAPRLIAARRP